jgi:hypothetical protein
VTGTGGVGKTRLVAEALGSLSERYGLPVTVTELAGATAGQADGALALALGLGATAAVRTAVLEYLSISAGLLVLDNCEHVLGDIRALAEQILRRCPGIRNPLGREPADSVPLRLSLGPGRVIVSWSRCDCEPARAVRPHGAGHQTVRCQPPGCRARWFEPRRKSAADGLASGRSRGCCTCPDYDARALRRLAGRESCCRDMARAAPGDDNRHGNGIG